MSKTGINQTNKFINAGINGQSVTLFQLVKYFAAVTDSFDCKLKGKQDGFGYGEIFLIDVCD